MTLHRLKQYRAMVREITNLELRIADLRRKVPGIVTDSVKGSSPYFPYIEQSVAIQGYNPRERALMNEVAQRLERRKEKLLAEIAEIEAFLDSLEDSTDRLIISLRYIQGKSWRAVSQEVYGRLDMEDAARMRAKRFLKE